MPLLDCLVCIHHHNYTQTCYMIQCHNMRIEHDYHHHTLQSNTDAMTLDYIVLRIFHSLPSIQRPATLADSNPNEWRRIHWTSPAQWWRVFGKSWPGLRLGITTRECRIQMQLPKNTFWCEWELNWYWQYKFHRICYARSIFKTVYLCNWSGWCR